MSGGGNLKLSYLKRIEAELNCFFKSHKNHLPDLKINGASFDHDSWSGLSFLLAFLTEYFKDPAPRFEGTSKEFQAAMVKANLARRGKCGQIVLTDLFWELRDFVKTSTKLSRDAAKTWKPQAP